MKKIADQSNTGGGRLVTYEADAGKINEIARQVHHLLMEITEGPHEGMVVLTALLEAYKKSADVTAIIPCETRPI